MLKIATWNVNSLRVRLAHVLAWLGSQAPDIVALQETKMTDDVFPAEELLAAGYKSVFSGQKTYNGVAILTKTAAEDVATDIPKLTDPQRRILAATVEGVRVINLYVPNGASVDSDKYEYKLDWLSKINDYIAQQLKQFDRVVVLGDFNIAPEDRDVHDPAVWEGNVLVSAPEREALQAMLKLGLQDSFRLFEQEEKSYSWWDYRAAAFRRKRGMRIDHILVSEDLAQRCQRCIIDKEPRTWERPSDHTPVMAEFN